MRTDDAAYYRWTQWIFVQLFKAGLAERKESPVIWCPSCLTVLAFEQIDGGKCERCESVVSTRVMNQWYLCITKYADQLLDTLDELDWSPKSKHLQSEWIGRSIGTDVQFRVTESQENVLTAITTRVDTIYGVTFLAVVPNTRSSITSPSTQAMARR